LLAFFGQKRRIDGGVTAPIAALSMVRQFSRHLQARFRAGHSNLLLYIISRQPDGPILIGQETEYSGGIQSLSESIRYADLI
jgi:hypothetical protein